MKKTLPKFSILILLLSIKYTSQQVKNLHNNCHYSCSECLSNSYLECVKCSENRTLIHLNQYSGLCTCPLHNAKFSHNTLEKPNLYYEDGENGCRAYKDIENTLYTTIQILAYLLFFLSILELLLKNNFTPLFSIIYTFQNIGTQNLMNFFKIGAQRQLFAFFYHFHLGYFFSFQWTELYHINNTQISQNNSVNQNLQVQINQDLKDSKNIDFYLQFESFNFFNLTWIVLVLQLLCFISVITSNLILKKIQKNQTQVVDISSYNTFQYNQNNTSQNNTLTNLSPIKKHRNNSILLQNSSGTNGTQIQKENSILGETVNQSTLKIDNNNLNNNSNINDNNTDQNQNKNIIINNDNKTTTNQQQQQQEINISQSHLIENNNSPLKSITLIKDNNNNQQQQQQDSDTEQEEEDEQDNQQIQETLTETQKEIQKTQTYIQTWKTISARTFLTITILTFQEFFSYFVIQTKISSSFQDILFIIFWIILQWFFSPLLIFSQYNQALNDLGLDWIFPKKNILTSPKQLKKQKKHTSTLKKNYPFFIHTLQLFTGIFLAGIYSDTTAQFITLILLNIIHLQYLIFVRPFHQDSPYYNFRLIFSTLLTLSIQTTLLIQSQFTDKGSESQTQTAEIISVMILGFQGLFLYIHVFSYFSQNLLNKNRQHQLEQDQIQKQKEKRFLKEQLKLQQQQQNQLQQQNSNTKKQQQQKRNSQLSITLTTDQNLQEEEQDNNHTESSLSSDQQQQQQDQQNTLQDIQEEQELDEEQNNKQPQKALQSESESESEQEEEEEQKIQQNQDQESTRQQEQQEQQLQDHESQREIIVEQQNNQTNNDSIKKPKKRKRKTRMSLQIQRTKSSQKLQTRLSAIYYENNTNNNSYLKPGFENIKKMHEEAIEKKKKKVLQNQKSKTKEIKDFMFL